MASVREKIQSYSVVITDDAKKRLTDLLVQMAEPYVSAKDSVRVDGMNNVNIRKEMSRVLADGRVYSMEAYPLYVAAEAMAGDDRRLEASEIDTTYIESIQTKLVETATTSFVADYLSLAELLNSKRIVEEDPSLEKDYGSKADIEKAIEETRRSAQHYSDVVGKGIFSAYMGTITLFTEDIEKKEIFEGQMKDVFNEMNLNSLLDFVRFHNSDLRNEDSTATTFIDIKNLFGLALFFHEDGSLFSTQEVNAADRFFGYLCDAYLGAIKFYSDFKEGIVDLDDRSVNTFLESPLAEMIDFSYLFGPDITVSSEDINPRRAEMYLGLVKKANKFGAGDLAVTLTEFGSFSLGPLAEDFELSAKRGGDHDSGNL